MPRPALRRSDLHDCPAHGVEKIGAAAHLDILVNGEPALQVGQPFACKGIPTGIVSGSTTVQFHGEFAARAFDDSDHGGKLIFGAGNVLIGGATGMGCVGAGMKSCQQMAQGRTSGKTSQSYGNCVLESVRQIIRRRTGNQITEDELRRYAEATGRTFPGTNGGANGDMGQQLLSDFGVPAERMPASGPASLEIIKQATSEGRGVVGFVEPHDISPTLYPAGGCHAVVVTGVELDDEGNVTAVFINDTGAGECGKRVPGPAFAAALRNVPSHKDVGGTSLLVTKGTIG